MIDAILNAVLILAVTQLALGVILWLRVRKLYSYPGLLGWPVIGNLYYFYKTFFIISTAERMLSYYTQLTKKYAKNGICFHYMYGFHKLVIVSSPRVIKEIGLHANLKDKPEYAFQGMRIYLDGLFTLPYTDRLWKIKRKEYDSLLRKAKIETNYYDTFLKSANRLVDTMLASSSAFNVQNTVIGFTQNVTMETLMDVKTSWASHPQVIQFMHILGKIASPVIGSPLLWKILFIIIRPIDQMIFPEVGALREAMVDEVSRKKNNPEKYLTTDKNTDAKSYNSLSMYIASRIERDEQFEQRVNGEVQELFVTSTHTVATAMSNAITFLAVIPEIQKKAWLEQYEIFGDDTREPTFEDLEQMKYLERIIKETLRFCAPMFVAKLASDNIEVDGVIIPKDATVVYLLDFMRKDPTYWKDPDVFEPDRFLEENELLKYSFAPFGIGIRICPGVSFAMMQLKITLSKILRKTKVLPVQKGLKFEDLQFEALVLMEIKNPPLLQIEKRV